MLGLLLEAAPQHVGALLRLHKLGRNREGISPRDTCGKIPVWSLRPRLCALGSAAQMLSSPVGGT